MTLLLARFEAVPGAAELASCHAREGYVSDPLLAHGIGGASDLPIPLSYAMVGAGWALTVSFAILAFSWRTSRFRGDEAGRPLPRAVASVVDSRWTRGALRALGLALTAYLGWAALAGQDVTVNPALGVFYVYLWVGMVPLSLLVGNVWPLLSPMRTLHLGLTRAMRTAPESGIARYPSWLGVLAGSGGPVRVRVDRAGRPGLGIRLHRGDVVPAVRGGDAGRGRGVRQPVVRAGRSVRRLLRAGGAAVTVGPPHDGRLVVRNPLDGLDGVVADRGLLAVVSVLLGSTAFDSFAASTYWLTKTARPGGLDPQLRDTLVLLGFVALVAATFGLAAMATAGVSWTRRRELPRLMAHSLVPIIVGYVFAHYLTFLVEYGQSVLVQLSDPLTRGDDYLGTAGLSVHYVLSTHPTALALIKVAAIITGHLLAVVAAHDRAVRLLPARHAVVGQLAMLLVMVGYTSGGLLLLFNA